MNVSKAFWTLGTLIGAKQAVSFGRRFEFDDLLGLIGLQQRRSSMQLILPAIGLVSLGAAIGAGAALLVAPSSGAELRKRLSDRLDNCTAKVDESENPPHQPTNTSPTPVSHA
jgi:hypothetical protein